MLDACQYGFACAPEIGHLIKGMLSISKKTTGQSYEI
jgi:hypothetical protein